MTTGEPTTQDAGLQFDANSNLYSYSARTSVSIISIFNLTLFLRNSIQSITNMSSVDAATPEVQAPVVDVPAVVADAPASEATADASASEAAPAEEEAAFNPTDPTPASIDHTKWGTHKGM
jgi:hypothetical protein